MNTGLMKASWHAAFAPATVANVNVGFDVLGFAIEGPGDRVRARRSDRPGVHISKVEGGVDVPLDPLKNTATRGIITMLDRMGTTRTGIEIEILKGVPRGSGLGGSASSAVAGVFAANAALGMPFQREDLFEFALEGEVAASGARHGDNVAPALFGGLQLVLDVDAPRILRIPVPPGMRAVVVHPNVEIETRQARGILSPTVPLATHVRQSARLGAFIAACHATGSEVSLPKYRALLKHALEDLVVEPQRKHLIPGFDQVRLAAVSLGALAAGISGSGPSVFAWLPPGVAPEPILLAMKRAFLQAGIDDCRSYVTPIGAEGARMLASDG